MQVQKIINAPDVASYAASFAGLDFIFDTWQAYFAYNNGFYEDAAITAVAVSIGIVTSGELKAVLKGLRKGELGIVKFFYNTKISIAPISGNLYATFIPIVVKLNMNKILSNGLVSAIRSKDTFIKLISYAKKAEYQSLVPVFERAVAETNGFKDLINGSPVAVDVFFGLAKQNPSIAVEEIVGVSNLARNLPDESISAFVSDLANVGLRAQFLKEA